MTAQPPTGPATLLRVVLDRPLRTALDYLPPAGMDAGAIAAGVRVRVPVGRGQAIGLVVGHATESAIGAERLRAALTVVDIDPVLDAGLLGLLTWTADYYHHPPGEVLFGALPGALRDGADLRATERRLRLTPLAAVTPEDAVAILKRAPRQQALWQVLLQAGGPLDAPTLDERDAGWRTAAQALLARGWVEWVVVEAATATAMTAPTRPPPPAPTGAQAAAIEAIDAAHDRFAALLLQGATGSGKTEVYLRAVEATLARGRTALVLVPEIGLTPQLVGRFRDRFGVPIALLHSALGDGERVAAWRSAWSGAARIAIGTRSAVFAPLRDLGLIVVDEEHDSSYKQQEGGCHYSARDLAVRRAQMQGIPVVLGSATPALESLHNVQAGRYERFVLPRRDDQAPAPRLGLIDLRTQSVHAGLSGAATQAMQRHLTAGGQVLVYINRRGFAPTLLCTSCGWIAPCRHCDARMTVHQKAGRLRCHHCGADEPLPERCGRCGFAVKPVGQGTERIEVELATMFPDRPLARLDRDTARTARDIERVAESVLSGEARILVGTQMVTKGHHFPDVTLVVVLNADGGLFSTDFRAAERLAQTIVQVAGRAGRAERSGEVLIQTEYPEHPLLQQLLDAGYEGFATVALAERAEAHWPPFARIALLRASATDASVATAFLAAARALAEDGPAPAGAVRLLGPVPAAMARRAGRHHAQLLVESPGRAALQNFLRRWLPHVEQLPDARRVRWSLDVDPLETQ